MYPPDLLFIIRITLIASFVAWAGKIGVVAFLTFPVLVIP